MEKTKLSALTITLIVVVVALAVVGTIVTIVYPDFVFQFQPGVQKPGETQYVPGGTIYEIIYILLTMSTDVMYLLGGGIVFFGAILATVRFIKSKTTNPNQPSGVTHMLSGYLTLGLAFFIGAEIIKTVVVRTYEEFVLLVFIIISRGLFSLILYLERRWHGGAETE
jgi:uncharacterized membrane protein